MIYRFRSEEIEPSPAYPFRFIRRPKIPVWVGVGDGPRRPFLGLLDTGADDTKMTIAQAERLGVSIDRAHPMPYRGVRGFTFGYFGEVTMELRQSPRSYVWTVQVAFLPDPMDATQDDHARVVLGHTGFFRYFHARFDYQRNFVKIKPNGLFVGRPR